MQWRALALITLLISCVTGQEREEVASSPQRRPHPGRVLDAAGEPVAGAAVTFLSGKDGLGAAADVAKAVAGDNGRFRARLLPGRRYQAFAVAPAGTLLAAAPTVSPLIDRGKPMTVIRFGGRLSPAPEFVSVDALEPWRGRGAVQIEIWLAGCRQVVSDKVSTDKGFLVPTPPLPDKGREVLVYVGGQLVYVQRQTRSFEVDLPPPFVVRGRVTTTGGKAVAGAQILRIRNWRQEGGPVRSLRDSSQRHLVAVTDKDGAAEWVVASHRDPFIEKPAGQSCTAYIAAADGYRDGISGFARGVISNLEIITDEVKNRTLPFVLEQQQPLQVTVGPGLQANGVGWVASYMMPLMKFGSTNAFDARISGELVDGGTSLPWWPRVATEPRLYLRGVLPRLELGDPFRRVLTPRMLEIIEPDLSGPLRIDASEVVPVRVQLIGVDGNPASAVDVFLVSLENGAATPFVRPAATDTAGRVVFPAMAGRYQLIAIGDHDWTLQELDVAIRMQPLVAKLKAMPSLRLRVLDSSGEPVAGATASFSASASSTVPDPLQRLLQQFARGHVIRTASRCRSSRDGQLLVPFLRADGFRADIRVRSGQRSSAAMTLVETEEAVVVVLKAARD